MDIGTLLEVRELRTYFYTRRGVVKAVDGVSFSLNKGETLGLVGESGAGKTVTGLSLLRLLPDHAGRIVGGEIIFEGEDLLQKSAAEMRRIRGRKISLIPQDSMTSLNPAFTVGDQIGETIRLHQKVRGQSNRQKVAEILRLVQIPSRQEVAGYYPHQMSGGMRQRVAGAIAISCRPSLLIADEPTTSLDVTVQAQYLRLLREIQQQLGCAILFITHDFGVVAKMCTSVAVMYAGKIVEYAGVREIFSNPGHPYTMALFESLPKTETRVERLSSIEGQPPSLIDLPPGCSFAPRCRLTKKVCREESPPQVFIGDGRFIRCWKAS